MSRKIGDELNEPTRQFIGVPSTQTTRTLLLLGPSRAGKSTICQVLRDSRYQPPEPKLYSATREPEHHSVGNLRIIDMPGFCDNQPQSKFPQLTKKMILVITHAEEINEGQRHQLVDDLFVIQKLSNTA
ncbi:unnamed protein product [Adineta ricciae]|uniref:G domain-containing protein n=1 Tax=Adineta ricciae TaxID=249248 RepID=A0A815ELB5_ADIRI|nr:unnamed protein product [Adineta ricciae]CAF1308048.1 unnamed protein product [Adineta ricciae]